MNSHLRLLVGSLVVTTWVALPTIGLAAVDPYPNGCVSCHVLDKAQGVDIRLSVALKEWTAGKIEPGLLAKSKAAAPALIATMPVRRRRRPSCACCISCISQVACITPT